MAFLKMDEYSDFPKVLRNSSNEFQRAEEPLTSFNEGTNSIIFRTRDSKYVVKYIIRDDDNKEEIKNEIDMMKALDHPNILKYEEVFDFGDVVAIVMEYFDKGDLIDLNTYFIDLESKGVNLSILNDKIIRSFYGLALGFDDMYNKNIIHRDIKPENILYKVCEDYFDFVICDFGYARRIKPGEILHKQVGTFLYWAPEIYAGKGYSYPAEVWAFGVVFYMVLFGSFPFARATELLSMLKRGEFGEMDDHIKKFMLLCLNYSEGLENNEPCIIYEDVYDERLEIFDILEANPKLKDDMTEEAKEVFDFCMDTGETLRKTAGTFNFIKEARLGKIKQPSGECPQKVKDLIFRCLNPDPEKRPTFDQIVKDEIFDPYRYESSILKKQVKETVKTPELNS